jgi:hypothetical protein
MAAGSARKSASPFFAFVFLLAPCHPRRGEKSAFVTGFQSMAIPAILAISGSQLIFNSDHLGDLGNYSSSKMKKLAPLVLLWPLRLK